VRDDAPRAVVEARIALGVPWIDVLEVGVDAVAFDEQGRDQSDNPDCAFS
jgi:hypothetical protein